MATRIQIRRDTSTNWATENPVLAVGELALETDTVRIKCGDGSSDWNTLGYITDFTASNLGFNDNIKIELGTGNDLKLYHDGDNSFIIDDGTGDLYIRGSDKIEIGSTSGEKGIVFNENSSVELYHNNNLKLATSSAGIAVTGNISGATNINGTNINATTAMTTASLTASGNIKGGSFNIGNDWVVQLNGTVLEFAYGGTKKMKLDSSGNLTVVGDVTAYGTI
jgi:hypothetical protein